MENALKDLSVVMLFVIGVCVGVVAASAWDGFKLIETRRQLERLEQAIRVKWSRSLITELEDEGIITRSYRRMKCLSAKEAK
ncbi:MAG: hypothetical protein HUU43_15550 [Ignavibacteriaceae bacterium]|nr:hypothetical protein [Ignavibacteriaceae bacterium]